MIKTTRISNLDIIKILAAIAIVFHHYQQCFSVQFDSGALNCTHKDGHESGG